MSKLVMRGMWVLSFGRKTGAGNRARAAVPWLARVFLVGLAMMAGLAQLSSAQAINYTWTVNGTAVAGGKVFAPEGAGNITIGLRKTFDSTRAVNLSYSGVAGNGRDYKAGPARITLRGTAQWSFRIAITQDQIVEGNESFTITAVDAGDPRFRSSLTITITDDDSAVAPSVKSLVVDRSSLDEGNSGSKNVTATVTLDKAPTAAAVYELSLSGSSASVGSDYTLPDRILRFSARQTTTKFTISVRGDRAYEPDEQIVISIGSGTARKSATVTIRNDDKFAFSVSSKSVTEGGAGGRTQVKATVTLSVAATDTVTFPLSFGKAGTATRGDRATAAGVDFVSAERPTITIGRGQTTGSHTLTIVGDAAIEANETIVVRLGTGTNARSETITIANDDYADAVESLTVRLATSTASSNTLSVPEGNLNAKTNVIVTLTMAATSSRARQVNLTRGGSASAPSDFTPNEARPKISIGAGQRQGTYTLTINGDILNEADETIELTATGRNGATSKVTITITNDDNRHDVESVTVSRKSVTEGGKNQGTAVIVRVKLAASASTTRIVALALSGTAERGSDYTSEAAPRITIGANETVGLYRIIIKGDILDEPDQETIVITASVVGGGPRAATATETITINDDDDGNAVASLTFNPRGPITEGNKDSKTAVKLTVTMTAQSSSSRTVTLDFSASTAQIGTSATTRGVDFTTASKREVTIAANKTTATYSLDIIGDIIDENDEDIKVTAKVKGVSGNAGSRSAALTITDDDDRNVVASLAFNPSGPITEGDSGSQTVKLTVTMAAETSASRSVTLNFAKSTAQIGTSATQGVDFTTTSSRREVTIAANTTTAEYSIAVIGDIVDENDEQIDVTASVRGASGNAGSRSAALTIKDDDEFKIESLTATPNRVSENGDTVDVVARFTATLPAAENKPVTYSGSATPGVDYTGHRPSLTIPVATRSVRFRLTMVPDDLREEDETIVMTFLGETRTVTIIDEDTGAAVLDEVRQQAGAALLRRNAQRFAFVTNNVVTKRLAGRSANALSGDGRKTIVDVGATLNALGPEAQRADASARERLANLWVSVEATRLEGDVTGDVYDIHAGADFKVTPDSLIGVLVSYEAADVATEKHAGKLKADGWSLGAYAGVRLAPDLTWDIAGSYGRQTPDVYARADTRSFFGSYTSNRLIVSSHLTGHIALEDGFVVKPTLGVVYGRDHQGTLTTRRGNTASARVLELGRVTLGPQVSYSTALPEGWGSVDLTASATGIYDFLVPEAEGRQLSDRLSGAFAFGLAWTDQEGISLDLGGSIDGVGVNGYDAYNVSGKLKFDF